MKGVFKYGNHPQSDQLHSKVALRTLRNQELKVLANTIIIVFICWLRQNIGLKHAKYFCFSPRPHIYLD